MAVGLPQRPAHGRDFVLSVHYVSESYGFDASAWTQPLAPGAGAIVVSPYYRNPFDDREGSE